MSKKKNKRKVKIIKPKSSSKNSNIQLNTFVRQVCAGMIYPINTEIKKMNLSMLEIKANLMAFMTLCERKKMVDKKDFEEIYQEVLEDNEVVNINGNMIGRPIFSIYYNKEL